MEPRIQYAKTSDGVNIAYTTLGNGPAIVLAGNVWGNINLYRAGAVGMARILDGLVSQGWSVVIYDGRGMGASERDAQDFTLAGRLRDLEAVVEAASLERFALWGWVQGGPAAVACAVEHPDKTQGLILTNTFATGSDWYELVPAMRVSKGTQALASADWEFFTLSLANAMTGYGDSDGARTLAGVFRAGMSGEAYVLYRDSAEKIDVRYLLSRIGVPTLVVYDRSFLAVTSGDVVQRLARQVPGSRFVETDDLAQVTDEFLRECGLIPEAATGELARKSATTPNPGKIHGGTNIRTVLFTDLVGHAEMMSRLGDERGRDVLREHERITRDVLKAHGGTEVKTMGDGFLASFGSVTKAVECAVALQRAFAEREGEPLSVRVGLNAGEPIEEDGDLFGSTVILASRIAAKADGGEILVADTVRGLCSGKGFLFADRGEFVAKGFEEPVRVSEVSWRHSTAS